MFWSFSNVTLLLLVSTTLYTTEAAYAGRIQQLWNNKFTNFFKGKSRNENKFGKNTKKPITPQPRTHKGSNPNPPITNGGEVSSLGQAPMVSSDAHYMVVPPRSSSLKGHNRINTGHSTSQNPLSKSKSPVVISDTNGLAQPLPENYLVAPTRSSSLKAYRDSQPPGTGNKHDNSFIKATAAANIGNKQSPQSIPGTVKKDLSTMSVDDIRTNPDAVSQALKSANSKTDLERIDSFVKSSVEELRRIHNARDMSEAERNNRELKIMNVLKYAPRQDMKTSLSGGLASDMNFFTESSNQLMSVQKATNAIFGKSLSELKGHEFAKARDVFLSTLKYSLVQERKKILNDPNILKKLLEEGKVLQFKKGDIQTFIRTYEDDIFLGPRKQLDIELNKIYK